MSRLLTIVNERKKLRNEYRKHLEDEYIAKKKSEELAALNAKNAALGLKSAPTPEELRSMLAQRSAKKFEAVENKFNTLKDAFAKPETAKSPLLNEGDLKLISSAQTKLNQSDILKMYVKNWGELDLRQRRRVMAHVQAQRAKHAKEVFLKELAAIGRKLSQ